MRTVCFTITAAFVLALALMFCAPSSTANTWRADVYPDRNDLTKSRFIGTFDSLEACREAARKALRDLGATESGDYECGKNCKPMFPELADSAQVCEETLR